MIDLIGSARPLSRTPSTTTITQAQPTLGRPSSRTQALHPRQSIVLDRKDQGSSVARSPDKLGSSLAPNSPLPPASPSSSSSPSSSDSENPAKRSQLFKRPPRFRAQRPRELIVYDEATDEGEEAAIDNDTALPFAQMQKSNHRPTSRVPPAPPKLGVPAKSPEMKQPRTIFTSDPSSGAEVSSSTTSSVNDAARRDQRLPGAFSLINTNETTKSSPRKAALKAVKDGSEGTPSMGSSFSDLDGT
jgi:hypothetical protein